MESNKKTKKELVINRTKFIETEDFVVIPLPKKLKAKKVKVFWEE